MQLNIAWIIDVVDYCAFYLLHDYISCHRFSSIDIRSLWLFVCISDIFTQKYFESKTRSYKLKFFELKITRRQNCRSRFIHASHLNLYNLVLDSEYLTKLKY